MTATTIWFIVACILIIFELFTGTFYLLVFGIAALGAAGIAYLGLPPIPQLITAAIIATAGVIWLRSRPAPSHTDTDNLDNNQAVEIIHWRNDTNARVRYRGTEWDAQLLAHTSNTAAHYLIHETRANTLIIKPATE
jgi:membrane protein implicated in regulation of membrane protease activity